MKTMIIICYDAAIDVDELNEALRQFVKPKVFSVKTQQSDYAIAVGEDDCTQQDAQAAWDAFGT